MYIGRLTKINSIIYKSFSRVNSGNKNIFGNKKKFNLPKGMDAENTIDITDSAKEFKTNINLEIQNLEKIINRNPKVNKNSESHSNEFSENSEESSNFKLPNEKYHDDITQEIKNIADFDIDVFKKRNKEIQNKSFQDKKPKTETKNPEESYMDEKTYKKLQELIKKDDQEEGYKTFNSTDENTNYKIDDEKNVLVHRPLKNFVWGLGQQTKKKKFKFVVGEYPTLEALVSFLEVNNLHDIIVVPTHQLGLKHLKETSIICSGHTTRHIYKVAKDLVVDLKALNIPNLPFVPTVFGRRDEEWLIVEIGEIQIYFFVETFRKEMDLLDIWLNPPEEEFVKWNRRVENMYYGKKR